MEREGQDRKLGIKRLTEDTSCFGANIYNLMKNSFFMENTIGEFATQKINAYMKKIHTIDGNEEEQHEIECFVC